MSLDDYAIGIICVAIPIICSAISISILSFIYEHK